MNPQIKQTLLIICLQTLGLRLQRYNKICRCARKIAFSCVFLLGGLSPSTKLPRGTQGYSACTLSGKTITEIPEYDSWLMDKERTEYSTTCRGNRRIFTQRTIASALDRWQGTGKVLDGNRVVTKWFRSGNEKGSGKKQGDGRGKIRGR